MTLVVDPSPNYSHFFLTSKFCFFPAPSPFLTNVTDFTVFLTASLIFYSVLVVYISASSKKENLFTSLGRCFLKSYVSSKVILCFPIWVIKKFSSLFWRDKAAKISFSRFSQLKILKDCKTHKTEIHLHKDTINPDTKSALEQRMS